jgi:hypothetical protein
MGVSRLPVRRKDKDDYNTILYLFTCWAQQPIVSYGVNTNTNNSNKTTQDKTSKKQQQKDKENGASKAFYTRKWVIKIYVLSRVEWYAWREWRVLVRMIVSFNALVTTSFNYT